MTVVVRGHLMVRERNFDGFYPVNISSFPVIFVVIIDKFVSNSLVDKLRFYALHVILVYSVHGASSN